MILTEMLEQLAAARENLQDLCSNLAVLIGDERLSTNRDTTAILLEIETEMVRISGFLKPTQRNLGTKRVEMELKLAKTPLETEVNPGSEDNRQMRIERL